MGDTQGYTWRRGFGLMPSPSDLFFLEELVQGSHVLWRIEGSRSSATSNDQLDHDSSHIYIYSIQVIILRISGYRV